jgi:hypothetical protein
VPSSSNIFLRETEGDRWIPEDYQDETLRFLLQNMAAGVFLDPGLGKTSTTYAAISVLLAKGMIPCALVVAPLRPAYQVWPAERDKWRDFRHLRVEVLHGEKKGEAADRPADVYVINPEGLKWLLEQKRPSWLRGSMLVVDESTRFKNSQAKRFKLLRKHLDKFKRRVILTGSPRPKQLEDLFAQVYLLDQGNALGRYVTHFRHRFCLPGFSHDNEWVPRPGAEDEVYRLIAPMVKRMSAEDYLKLPPIVDPPVIEVDLPPRVRRVYDEVEREFVAELESGKVVASNAAAKTAKLRQIANGGVYTDKDRGQWENLHYAKEQVVEEISEELGGAPMLVAYDTKHDLDRLREVFGGDLPYLGGGVSAKRGKQLEDAWNAGDLPVLAVHPASVAHGLNLQEAGKALVWHSLTYNYEDYDQLIRRLWRKGRKDRVFRYHVLARDTVDAAIFNTLQRKGADQESFFEALRRYYLEGEKSLCEGFTKEEDQDNVGSNDQPIPIREEAAMSTYQEGQRVRLLPDEDEGIPEEFGKVTEVGEEAITVQLDDDYVDHDDPQDDGLREVSLDELEAAEDEGGGDEAATEEAEPEEEEEPEPATGGDSPKEEGTPAYIVNCNRMTVIGKYLNQKVATDVVKHYEASRSNPNGYAVLRDSEEGMAKDLSGFGMKALVKLYNAIVGTKHQVSKFTDKKNAAKRIHRALDELGMEVTEEPPVAAPEEKSKTSDKKKEANVAKQEGKTKQKQPAPKKPKGPSPEVLMEHLPKSFPKPEEGEKSGQYIRRLLAMETYSDETICAASLQFIGGKTKPKDVQWNRSQLKKKGEHVPERITFGEGKGEKQLAKKAEVDV